MVNQTEVLKKPLTTAAHTDVETKMMKYQTYYFAFSQTTFIIKLKNQIKRLLNSTNANIAIA